MAKTLRGTQASRRVKHQPALSGDAPSKDTGAARSSRIATEDYVLENQIGFVLRQVTQRHALIFSDRIPQGLTPTQFSALVKLYQHGTLSQNHLGRLTAMDIATVKGVTDRLQGRGYVTARSDAKDARLRVLSLTDKGRAIAKEAISRGGAISRATLQPLSDREGHILMRLLRRLT